MARLCGVLFNRAAAQDALARRQFGLVLDGIDQQSEGLLRMGLDKLQLRKCQLEGFDVATILHLIEAVGCSFLVITLARCSSHMARGRASMVINRQQHIRRAGYGDEWSADPAGGAEICKIFGDIGYGQSADIDLIAEPRAVGVVSRVHSLLPLAHGEFPEPEVMKLP
jgi:hypothetical protein